jgi:hypothetical protein
MAAECPIAKPEMTEAGLTCGKRSFAAFTARCSEGRL